MQDNEGGFVTGASEFIEQNETSMASFAIAVLKSKNCSDPEGHVGLVLDRVRPELMKRWQGRGASQGEMFWLTSFRARDHARACRREIATDIGEEAVPLFGKPELNPEELATRAELVSRAFAALNEEEMIMVELKVYEGLTFEAIGVRLQKHPAAVAAAYYRALKKMRASLGT